MTPQIAPSILAADFANLQRAIDCVEQAGAEMIHVDVMDGHFVPNLTIGPPVVECIRKVTDLKLDVHLMITNPEQLARSFLEAGADYLSVHIEAATHLHQVLEETRRAGVQAGVVLNPHTPVATLDEIVDFCDMILIMSVNPGFGGQEFISTSFEKVRKLRQLLDQRNPKVLIEIDGGIGLSNVSEAVSSGVDIVVAVTAIFGTQDPGSRFREMQRLAERAGLDRSAAIEGMR